MGENMSIDETKKQVLKKLIALEKIIADITDNSEIIFSFLQKYIVCEICYKALLLVFRADKGKCISDSSLKVNVGEVKKVFAYFGYVVDVSTIEAVYSSEDHTGRRSCKKLRDNVVHGLKKSYLEEIVSRSIELHEKMDVILCSFKDE